MILTMSHDPATKTTATVRPVLAIPLLSTAFGFVSGSAVDQQLSMAAFGLVWGVVAVLLAERLVRRGAQSPEWANAPLYLACALVFMSLGGAIFSALVTPDPQSDFEIVRNSAYGPYFASIHMLFEWLLLPAALFLNWTDRPRRYLLLIAATVFYVFRIASALYFAPTAMGWADLPAGTVVSGSLQADVETWTTLNLLRLLLQDCLVAALLTVVTLRRHRVSTPG